MNHPAKKNNGKLRGAATIAVATMLVGIGWSVGIDIHDRFIVRGQDIIMNRYATEIDPLITQAAAGNGVYMRFVHFDGAIAGFTTNFYFRANYILFPQRVLVGDPSAAINTPDQVLAANFIPDNAWLLSHDVPTLVTYYYRNRTFNLQVKHAAAAATR